MLRILPDLEENSWGSQCIEDAEIQRMQQKWRGTLWCINYFAFSGCWEFSQIYGTLSGVAKPICWKGRDLHTNFMKTWEKCCRLQTQRFYKVWSLVLYCTKVWEVGKSKALSSTLGMSYSTVLKSNLRAERWEKAGLYPVHLLYCTEVKPKDWEVGKSTAVR